MYSMEKMRKKQLTPFLSPMLEDDPGKISTKECQEIIHDRNYKIIQECIKIVCEELPPESRNLAIKLTAFMPPSFLVSIMKKSLPFNFVHLSLQNKFQSLCLR